MGEERERERKNEGKRETFGAIGRVRFQSAGQSYAKERSLILTRSRAERMALVKQRR